MSALVVVTLIYLVILVAVLASCLILVAVRLAGTARAIRRTRDRLAEVEANTRPLRESVEAINQVFDQLADKLGSVSRSLERAERALSLINERKRSRAA